MFDTRAAAWGDFDLDGKPDLYVGFAEAPMPGKLYRNLGGRFEDVAERVGITRTGTIRQPVFVDYDGDGDLDFYLAFRDRPNALYRSEGGRFTDVAAEIGLADTRRTIGAVWFDFDQDGDLDVVNANQEGDPNALFRNDGGRFVDVAPSLGIDQPGRAKDQGGIGPVAVDYDNDGDFDLFIASYGPDVLWRNDGGAFTNVAAELGIAPDDHSVAAAWGDLDNDGWLDLWVTNYLSRDRDVADNFFLRRGERFERVIDSTFATSNGSHGVTLVDIDGDGDLDLHLANNHASGTNPLFENLLPADRSGRWLGVLVRDGQGRFSLAGAEVRIYRPGTREVIASRLVDAGSGYNSQSLVPVHFGLARDTVVDLEVTVPTGGKRVVTRRGNVRRGQLLIVDRY